MKTSIEIEKNIINLVNLNFSKKEICKKLNINYSSVYSVCKRLKLVTKKECPGGKNIKNMEGTTFGALKVIQKSTYKAKYTKTIWWECECLCGKKCIVNGTDLRTGKTKTCGCRTSIKNKRNWQGYNNIPKSNWRVLNNNAIQRSLEFNLTIEYCDELFEKQNKKCYLSGLDISFKDKTASLDRIDNTKGYIVGNVGWVHKTINNMKQAISKEDFIYFCKKVSEFNKTS